MKNHTQKGFSAVEAIIILIVIALLALGGWYVWKKNNKDDTNTNKNTTSQQKEASKEEEQKPVDPTEDWTTYTNEKGKYTLKHPASWVKPSNLDACTEGLVLLAPSEASLGRCASEHAGQVRISSDTGDNRNEWTTYKQSYYKNVQTEPVTVDGVEGTKYTTTVMGMGDEVFAGAYPDNTKIIQYIFVTNGRTYIAVYAQYPNYPDVLNDFNLIITKTLKFNK